MYSFRLPKDSPLRRRSFIKCGPNKCAQDMVERSNINYIVKQHLKTGTPFPTGQMQFLDVSEIPDFQSRLQTILRGADIFEQLPVDVRRVYQTPEQFLAALDSQEGRSMLKKLGFLKDTPPKGENAGEPAKKGEGTEPDKKGAPPKAGGGSPSGTPAT